MKRSKNTKNSSHARDLFLLRLSQWHPLLEILLWLVFLITLIVMSPNAFVFALLLGFLGLLFAKLSPVLAGILVTSGFLIELLIRKVGNKPKVFSKQESAKIRDKALALELNRPVKDDTLPTVITSPKSQKNDSFWLGVIAGAIGISVLSGCDKE